MLETQLLLVASERPLINIDVTLLINISLWLVLFLFLRATLWKPVLALINAREERTEGARAEARRIEATAQDKRKELEGALREARNRAAAARDKLREEGLQAESTLLQQVRAEVAQKLERQRAELRTQRERLRAEVRVSVPSFAADIVRRILGREVQP